MLEAARSEVEDQKRDVVVGIVETHGRYDTGSLLIGLELLPRRTVEHRGIDARGVRPRRRARAQAAAHPRRRARPHQRAGLAPPQALAGRRGAARRGHRRLHDAQRAAPREPQRRRRADHGRRRPRDRARRGLRQGRTRCASSTCRSTSCSSGCSEGKVYVPQQAARAVENFFREGNLIALRELALRRTAERVDAKMRGYKAAHGIEESWHTGERVLVCVSPSPHSARLVRAARRMATSLHAELVGVYVETPASLRMSARGPRAARRRTCASSSRSAASRSSLRGEDAAAETVRYARKRNVTKIVVGKPTHARWRDVVAPVVPRRDRAPEPRDRRLRHLRPAGATRRRRRSAREEPRRPRARSAASRRRRPSSTASHARSAGTASGTSSWPTS